MNSSINSTFSPVPKISNLIGEIIRYLQESHSYYTTTALVALSSAIESLIANISENQRKIIWKFFTEYKMELNRHFEKEECEVIPYIQNLLDGNRNPELRIDQFCDTHSNIDEKLSDLKSILQLSLADNGEQQEKEALFAFMSRLKEDFKRHTYVEDEVMEPLVRLLENMPPSMLKAQPQREQEEGSSREELSDREKEILKYVAQGLLNKEIADRLNISINTVITHRKNITGKTGIKSVAGLTAYAILNNLVDINSIENA
ncbi:MAG: helix-turn-helix transcriptional regulator [Bacteroidales bacterium]|nr:helix-turn-helix transcriptional regulator [Candidatus Cryptobacteroides equifaecalis]